jgi:hypothetical protein
MRLISRQVVGTSGVMTSCVEDWPGRIPSRAAVVDRTQNPLLEPELTLIRNSQLRPTQVQNADTKS